MNLANYTIRRATLDDLDQLTLLWQLVGLPTDELARRVTEFQVAVAPDGGIDALIGLQMVNKQGLIHTECFRDLSMATPLRPKFWERIQSLAMNHGLQRLWTLEQAAFWKNHGLMPADDTLIGTLPPAWRGASEGWLTLKLRDGLEQLASTNHEFAMFMAAEKERTARTIQGGKALKLVATVIAFALLIIVIAGLLMVAARNPGALRLNR